MYIIDESWKSPDEIEHTYYYESFSNKEKALKKAKELVKDESKLFDQMDKEYHVVCFNNGYTVITSDSEYEYTATVVSIKENTEMAQVDIFELVKIYSFISLNYKIFITDSKQEPDFVEVDIKWKDGGKTERAIIAFNDKHDDLVTFRVDNLLELALLFFEESREDFICEHVHNMYFGIWY